jgi:hypothetical protein
MPTREAPREHSTVEESPKLVFYELRYACSIMRLSCVGQERLQLLLDRVPKRALSPRSHDRVVADFERYLIDVCGAAPATRRFYLREAEGLLAMKFGSGKVTLAALEPKDMRAFVDERARMLCRTEC